MSMMPSAPAGVMVMIPVGGTLVVVNWNQTSSSAEPAKPSQASAAREILAFRVVEVTGLPVMLPALIVTAPLQILLAGVAASAAIVNELDTQFAGRSEE